RHRVLRIPQPDRVAACDLDHDDCGPLTSFWREHDLATGVFAPDLPCARVDPDGKPAGELLARISRRGGELAIRTDRPIVSREEVRALDQGGDEQGQAHGCTIAGNPPAEIP